MMTVFLHSQYYLIYKNDLQHSTVTTSEMRNDEYRSWIITGLENMIFSKIKNQMKWTLLVLLLLQFLVFYGFGNITVKGKYKSTKD